MTDASLRIARLGIGGLELRELRGGADSLALDRGLVSWGAASLGSGRLEALRLEGLRIRAVLREGRLQLGAADAWRPAAGAAPQLRLPAPPADRFVLERAALALETPRGLFEAELEATLEGGSGAFAVRTPALRMAAPELALDPVSLAGEVQLGGDSAALSLQPAPFALAWQRGARVTRLRGVTPLLRLRSAPGGADLEHLEASGGELRLPELGVEARGLSLTSGLPLRGLPSGRLALAEIRDLRGRSPVGPLSLVGDFRPAGQALAFDGWLRAPGGSPRLHLRGEQQQTGAEGQLRLDLEPIAFGPDGVQPADLWPPLASWISEAEGRLEGHGELSWQPEGGSGFVDVGLSDLGFRAPGARIEGLNAVLRIDGWPPRLAPGQLVSIARLDFGLELTEGLVEATLDREGGLELASARFRFAGGTVRSEGRVDLLAEERPVLLSVEGVDLGQLLERVRLEGLSGTGRIHGRLPLVFGAGGVEIRDARLRASQEGGWIRYRPPAGASGLGPGLGGGVDTLLQALHNFRYQRLSLSADGMARGALQIQLSVFGSNPDVDEEQPYELNLSLEAHLVDLIRRARLSSAIPERIERRLRELAEERGP